MRGVKDMEKLSTIQKRENLNEVHRHGDPSPGSAYHDYDIYQAGDNEEPVTVTHLKTL